MIFLRRAIGSLLLFSQIKVLEKSLKKILIYFANTDRGASGLRLLGYINVLQVPSCVGSGLFKAFSEHTLHRLGVKQDNHSVSLC